MEKVEWVRPSRMQRLSQAWLSQQYVAKRCCSCACHTVLSMHMMPCCEVSTQLRNEVDHVKEHWSQ